MARLPYLDDSESEELEARRDLTSGRGRKEGGGTDSGVAPLEGRRVAGGKVSSGKKAGQEAGVKCQGARIYSYLVLVTELPVT